MLKIKSVTHPICSGKRITFLTVRNKFSKEQIIHRLMKEQKQAFGSLLETASQKRKRLKCEEKGVVGQKTLEFSVDSELSWAQKNTKIRHFRFIPLAAVSKKVDLVKSSHKHEQAATEAANGLITRFQKKIPTVINNKIPLIKPGVQKRIIRKLSTDSRTKAVAGSEKTILWCPEDIIKNINEARLLKGENKNFLNVSHSREIILIFGTESKVCLAYPSTTRILNATMSEKAKQTLEQWMEKMIEQLRQERFDEYKLDLLQNRNLFHLVIENTLRKISVEVPTNLKLCFGSVKDVLNEVENVRSIESQVVHRDLGYRGVLDCVASYRGKVYLIDWKKPYRRKELLYSTYDAPLQIASYIGVLNADDNYPFQVSRQIA